MRVVQCVDVFESAGHLEEPQVCLRLRHDTLVLHVVQQVAVFCPLHEYEDSVTALQNAVNSDDVGMGNFRENFDFAWQKLYEEIFRCFAFIDIFASEIHCTGPFVFIASRDNISVRPLADPLAKVIASLLQSTRIRSLTPRILRFVGTRWFLVLVVIHVDNLGDEHEFRIEGKN